MIIRFGRGKKRNYRGWSYQPVRNINGSRYVTVYNRCNEPVTTMMNVANARNYIKQQIEKEKHHD